MKLKKIILIFIMVLGILLFINTISNAATASITDNKTVTVGTSVTVTGSANAGAWNLILSGNGQSKHLVGYTNTQGNGNGSASISFTPNKVGTYTFTLSGDITDYDTEKKSQINKTCTITVKEKENNSTNNSNNNNNNQNQQEPTFTGANQTVYATSDINVRSSYSTSSSAVGSLKKGDPVTRIGIGSNGWSKVTYNGKTAYISSSLLTTTKPKEEEKSTNKALKSLTIEQAVLDPEFNKDTTNYTITIGEDVTALKISALPEDEKAKVTISGNENLQKGANTIKISVTAEDGTVRTYTIIVNKQEGASLGLASLKINGASLNKSFETGVYEYTVNLQGNEDLNKLDITAIANKEDATIEVIGNENLTIGENVITIMVKSRDGKENVTYQILVNKEENANINTLKDESNNKNNTIFLFTAIGIFAIAILLIIYIIMRNRKKDEEEFGFNYSENSNIMEDLYGFNKESDIENEQSSIEKTKTKLYNVEKEVDFSEDNKKSKRKGKHSK